MGNNKYLVALEGLDTSSTLRSGVGVTTPWCHELPHFDGLIQTSTDQILAVRSECYRVDAVLVAIGTF